MHHYDPLASNRVPSSQADDIALVKRISMFLYVYIYLYLYIYIYIYILVRIYTHYNPPTYDVQLVPTGATLYCDLRELVPVDGDYYHFRLLLAYN